MSDNTTADGYYTRQYLLRLTVPPSRSRPCSPDLGEACTRRWQPPIANNDPARRQPSAPSFTSQNEGASLRPIDSDLLNTVDSCFGEYMRSKRSLGRLDSSPDRIPRLFVPNTGGPRNRRARSTGTKTKDKFSATTSTGPTPQSTKGVQKDVIQEKKSRKVSWSQYETLGNKHSKEGMKRVYQTLHIEESVIDERQKNAESTKTQEEDLNEAYLNPYLAIQNGEVVNEVMDQNLTKDVVEMSVSASRRKYSEVNFDSYLADCNDLLEELKVVVEKRTKDGSAELDLQINSIVQILARKYVARMEEEWSGRRESWLTNRLISKDNTEKEWGRGYEYKTFKDAVRNFNLPLQFPFDLSVAVLRESRGNPVFFDEVVRDQDHVESNTPSDSVFKEDIEDHKTTSEMDGKVRKRGSNGKVAQVQEKVPINIQQGNTIPMDKILDEVLQKNHEAPGGKQTEEIYIKPLNISPEVIDTPEVWEDLRNAEKDQNSNGYVGWWEALYRGTK